MEYVQDIEMAEEVFRFQLQAERFKFDERKLPVVKNKRAKSLHKICNDLMKKQIVAEETKTHQLFDRMRIGN